MKRILNVTLVFGLACTLACAPGSRHQQVAKPVPDNKGAKPQPSPSGTPVIDENLTPVVVNTPDVPQNKNLDLSSATLRNAEIVPPKSTDKAGSIVLSFTVADSKSQPQKAEITINADQTVTFTDTNFSSAHYTCSYSVGNLTPAAVTPANCSKGELTFIWNKMAGDAKISLIKDLPVTEAIDKVAANTPFGGALVQKLKFTLGDKTFKRINAEIVATGLNDSGTPDDKLVSVNDDKNISIMVFGLKGDLDKQSTHPAVVLNNSLGRQSSDSMSAKNQLIYSLGVSKNQNNIPLLPLTLTIEGPSKTTDGAGDISTDDTGAVADVPNANTDNSKPAAAGASATDKPAKPQDGTSSTSTSTSTGPGAAPTTTAEAAKILANQKAATKEVATVTPSKAPAGPTVSTAPVAQTVVAPTGINQNNFCEVRASVSTAGSWTWIESKIDIVSNSLSPNVDDTMANKGWQKKSCDPGTGRLAVVSGAPGTVSCLSRWIPNTDPNSHTETIIFSAADLKNPNTCTGRLTHYTQGNIKSDGTGCYVLPIDSLALHALNVADGDGYVAHWSQASRIDSKSAPHMWPINLPGRTVVNNPGQYEIHNSDKNLNSDKTPYSGDSYWDIFYKPMDENPNLQCWARTTKAFSTQK